LKSCIYFLFQCLKGLTLWSTILAVLFIWQHSSTYFASDAQQGLSQAAMKIGGSGTQWCRQACCTHVLILVEKSGLNVGKIIDISPSLPSIPELLPTRQIARARSGKQPVLVQICPVTMFSSP